MMSERKELGRIKSATFGFGGYQNVQFGVSVDLGGDAWSVRDWRGPWVIDRSASAEWSEADRVQQMFDACWWLRHILTKAKKSHVDQLPGTPIEVTFDGLKMVSWRVLDEVL